jgi:hypothetical protein
MMLAAGAPKIARGGDQPSAEDRAAVAGARRVDDLIAPVVKSFDVPAMAGLELEGVASWPSERRAYGS